MKQQKWTYSLDEECWDCDNEFDTKQEAIKAGKEDINCIESERFWVGLSIPIDKTFLLDHVRLFDIDNFNETMAEEAGGDEDFAPEDTNSKHLDELESLIANFIIEKFDTTLGWTIQCMEEVII